jgi:hypothetical protein
MKASMLGWRLQNKRGFATRNIRQDCGVVQTEQRDFDICQILNNIARLASGVAMARVLRLCVIVDR